MDPCKNRNGLLPYDVIEAAVCGDVEAMNAVLQHYAGYISSLCARRGFDQYGCPQTWIDENLRKRLETRLIIATLRFNLN